MYLCVRKIRRTKKKLCKAEKADRESGESQVSNWTLTLARLDCTTYITGCRPTPNPKLNNVLGVGGE